MWRANRNWEHFEADRTVPDWDLGWEFDGEPEFDQNRVIWDVDYRRRVIALLKTWREKHTSGEPAGSQLQSAA